MRREHATRHAPSHATKRATALLAWPLVTILALRSRDDPVFTLVVVVLFAMFVLFVWAMYKIERQLNDEGESLTYPWRVPSPKKKARHIDGVLSTSIRRLKSGEDEVEVLSSLRLHLEGKLPREADHHYRRAVDGLLDAAARDWVFDSERREASLDEAVMELWMTRAEFLKDLM